MKPAYHKVIEHTESLLPNSMITIDNFIINDDKKRIRTCIFDALTSTPRKIPCTFFYDETGSKLFEDITNLPEYYLTRTEIDLLKKVALQISKKLRNVDIIEFGSGDCTKVSLLLENIPPEFLNTIRYIPFDISNDAVQKSSNILAKKFPGIRIYGIVADFITQLDVIPKESKKVLCFLGSTIGNLSIGEARQLLTKFSTFMRSNDLLLIGFDMIKDKQILEKAYNDNKHITARFNKNILKVVNSHVNTNFDTATFKHIAFYNEKESRIEMHLEALNDIELVSPYLPDSILIKKGETIHTENSYKFRHEDIRMITTSADLEIQQIFTDKDQWFSLVQLIKK